MVSLVRETIATLESRDMSGPNMVMQFMRTLKIDADKEHFHALHISARNRLLSVDLVSVGTLTASLVHPRELFRKAIIAGCAGIVITHNHPSGDTRPSPEDRSTTRRIVQAGKILGIPVLDHVIWCESGYFSFKEDGAME